MKVALGVVQSDAKVVISSGEDCGIGKSEGNADDHDVRLELEAATELSWLALADCPDGTFNLEEPLRTELDLTE